MRRANPRQSDSAKEILRWFAAGSDGSLGKRFASKPSGTRADVVDQVFLSESYLRLREENNNLKRENKMLREKLEISFTGQVNPVDDIETRDIPRTQAKHEIASFFADHRGEVIYPSDVAAELNLSYLLVEEVIGELEDEGKIRQSV
jgi:hypothetical protein